MRLPPRLKRGVRFGFCERTARSGRRIERLEPGRKERTGSLEEATGLASPATPATHRPARRPLPIHEPARLGRQGFQDAQADRELFLRVRALQKYFAIPANTVCPRLGVLPRQSIGASPWIVCWRSRHVHEHYGIRVWRGRTASEEQFRHVADQDPQRRLVYRRVRSWPVLGICIQTNHQVCGREGLEQGKSSARLGNQNNDLPVPISILAGSPVA